MLADRALEEPACGHCVTARGKQEVNRLAQPIDGSVQVLPLPAHQHVGFVDTPRAPDRVLAPTKHLGQHRQHLQ
jgi:hypothetical protein